MNVVIERWEIFTVTSVKLCAILNILMYF
jgi:hypothetical protein